GYTPTSTDPYPGSDEVIRQAHRIRDLSEDSVQVMLESLAVKTRKQYNCAYKAWWIICTYNMVPVFNAKVPHIISFFQKQLGDKAFRYGTFNSFRSALALILPGNVGEDPQIRRFLRGVARLRPQRPKYNFVWDPQKEKLVTLLALTTSQRMQTLSLIRTKNVIISEEGIQILISDPIKTSGPNSDQPCLKIPYFPKRPELCVASVLLTYIKKTSTLGDMSEEFLLLTLRSPHKRASSQTLSRWIKGTLSKGYTPTSTDPYPGSDEVIRQAHRIRDLSEDSVQVMLESLAIKTRKQYNCAYKAWWIICIYNMVPVFNAKVPHIISFFQKQLSDKAFRYGTFNSFRSALALILPGNVGEDPQIRRFLRGVARLRPQRPKYNFVWDPQKVLIYLTTYMPNEELSLKKLTEKLVTLLALTTSQRMQTLSLSRTKNVIISEEGIQILISDPIKTSGPNSDQPCLKIPYFPKRHELCVASVLLTYIEKTSTLGDMSEEFLLLTLRSPHKRASSQTLSRWIKGMLSKVGINTNIFTAYSTRHATSAAFRHGVSLELIRKTAGWSEKSKVFINYITVYCRVVKKMPPKRTANISNAQKQELVAFVEEHPQLVSGSLLETTLFNQLKVYGKNYKIP
ncbi:hypothetical protein NQ314_012025, partial [Rhamnusium bicolor]